MTQDLALMNPHGDVPILVERVTILYESNIINEYLGARRVGPDRP